MTFLPARALALVAMAVAVAAAGCLDSSPAEPAPAGTLAQRLAADVPPLQWDGEAAIGWWEDFVTTYQKRDAFLPANDPATLHIADSLRALGLNVTVMHYPVPAPVVGLSLPDEVPLSIHTVVAHKPGLADPGHAIAIGAHYDTMAGTVEGAYDNGSGTAMVLDLCRHLAAAPMDRSLLCLFFDGEEEGILGSQAFLRDPPPGTPDIDVFLGFDMVGLNWPGHSDWKAYTWVGDEFAAELHPLVNETVHGVLGYPEAGAEVFGFNDRNSDEAAFAEQGIPTLRFAGGRTASAYDQYHMPGDTAQHVYDVAGGRESFEAGFGALVQEAYTLALMLDGTTLDELRAEYA